MVPPAILRERHCMHHIARALAPDAVKRLLPRVPKRVVVLGGGPTGLFCADRLRHHFEVTVVDPKEYFEFTPGVLRALADPAHLTRITFNYREVLERTLGVEFVLGEASQVEVAPAGGGGPAAGSVAVSTPGGSSSSRLTFDYCIAAVGVSNALWKPRISGPEGSAPGEAKGDERALDNRRAHLRSLREQIAGAREVVIVGAGLVGVELAGELTHFFPRLKVTLVDGAPTVLPQLAEGAREYAQAWLKQNGVKLKLGTPFQPEALREGAVVLSCVGTRSRSAGLFADSSVLKANGQIRVNRRMQVLRQSGPRRPAAGTADTRPGTPLELEPLGQGRVFAVGDAAAVEGVPTAQIIFHGEEMAAIAVASIESAEDIFSPLSLGKGRREAEEGQPLLCCTSLGPQDGMFSTQSELVSTGMLAAVQKQIIEDTKMSALRGDLLGTLLWMPAH